MPARKRMLKEPSFPRHQMDLRVARLSLLASVNVGCADLRRWTMTLARQLLTRENARGKITVAAVADNGDDHGIFRLARNLERRPQRAARRDAGEYAFFARELPCRF